ncbi:MAG: hypothetical protein IPI44_13550 [Sulfuritalea sp.]|nr:hypothetical protein [Sulfuritalea sp.]
MPLFALALGAVLFVLAWRGGERAGRALLLVLAACWLWVASAWHAQRYAPINWVAEYFAWAWGVQAVLLGLVAWQGRFDAAPAAALLRRAVWLIPAGGRMGDLPLLAPLLEPRLDPGRTVRHGARSTALATLGVLLTIKLRQAGWLFPIPAAWCLISGATLSAMDAPEFWIAPLASLLAVGLVLADRLRRQTRTQCPPRVA